MIICQVVGLATRHTSVEQLSMKYYCTVLIGRKQKMMTKIVLSDLLCEEIEPIGFPMVKKGP